jgi:hypothetical protein
MCEPPRVPVTQTQSPTIAPLLVKGWPTAGTLSIAIFTTSPPFRRQLVISPPYQRTVVLVSGLDYALVKLFQVAGCKAAGESNTDDSGQRLVAIAAQSLRLAAMDL